MDVVGEGKAAVYLFGSWACGEATPVSDIDVAIDPRAGWWAGALTLPDL
jgi:predicted nucleotidyltransferase